MDCFVVHFRGPYNLNGEALIANGFIVLDHKAAKEVARYLLLIRFSNSEFQANFCICYGKKALQIIGLTPFTGRWVDFSHLQNEKLASFAQIFNVILNLFFAKIRLGK